jgi:hypothetical protein
MAKNTHARKLYFSAQDGKCHYCEVAMVMAIGGKGRVPGNLCTVDHKTPRARGGSSHAHNKVAACYNCNNAKGLLNEEEFLELRAAFPFSGLKKAIKARYREIERAILDARAGLPPPAPELHGPQACPPPAPPTRRDGPAHVPVRIRGQDPNAGRATLAELFAPFLAG